MDHMKYHQDHTIYKTCIGTIKFYPESYYPNIYKMIVDHGDDSNRINDDLIREYLKEIFKHSEFDCYMIDYDLYNTGIFRYLVTVYRTQTIENIIKMVMRDKPKFCEKTVSFKLIQKNGCILVEGGNYNDSWLKLYFSNKKKSGGSKIKLIKKFEISKRLFVLIQFKNKNVVKRVLTHNNQHVEFGIKVHLFCDSLLCIDGKEAFIYLQISNYPIRLVIRNETYVDELRSFLSTYNITLIRRKNNLLAYFENEKPDRDQLDIYLADYQQRFDYCEWIIEKNLVRNIEQKLNQYYAQSNSVVLIFIDQCSIANHLIIRIEAKSDLIEDEKNRVNQLIENEKTASEISDIEKYEYNLLKKIDIENTLKSNFPNCSIQMIKSKLKFFGFSETIDTIKEILHKKLCEIQTGKFKIDSYLAIYLKNHNDIINETIYQETKCIWEYSVNMNEATSELIIRAMKSEHLFKNYEELNKQYTVMKVNFSKEADTLLNNEYGLYINKLYEENNVKKNEIDLKLDKKDRAVYCFGKKEIVRIFKTSIDDFFEDKTIFEHEIITDDNKSLRYLQLVVFEELLKKTAEINFYGRYPYLKLKVKSTKKDYSDFSDYVDKLLEKQKEKIIESEERDIANYYTSNQGRLDLYRIEKKNKCLIINMDDILHKDYTKIVDTVNDDDTENEYENFFNTDLAYDENQILVGCRVNIGNLIIHVHTDDFAIADVDAVINSIYNNELNLDGVLINACGEQLKNSFKSEILDSEHSILITEAGNLKSKRLLHVKTSKFSVKENFLTALEYSNEKQWKIILYPLFINELKNIDGLEALREVTKGVKKFLSKCKNKDIKIELSEIKICIQCQKVTSSLSNFSQDEEKPIKPSNEDANLEQDPQISSYDKKIEPTQEEPASFTHLIDNFLIDITKLSKKLNPQQTKVDPNKICLKLISNNDDNISKAIFSIQEAISKKKAVLKTGISTPSNWTGDLTLSLVQIEKDDNIYNEIVNNIMNVANSRYKEIIKIERIQNLRIYQQYQAHKQHFERRNLNYVNEKTLYHGSNNDIIESIWKFGFNRSFCGKNGTLYGKGVYFARDADYSYDYTDIKYNKDHGCLFVCKVLIGYYSVGSPNTETKNLPRVNGQPVDSTVNQMQNPSIFVVYHDAQAYPEYLVTFR